MPGHRLVVLLFAMACVAFAGGAQADESELSTLRQQVEELKDTVRQLQERINTLEKKEAASWIPATIAPAPAAASTAAPAQASAPKNMDTAPASDPAAPAAKGSIDDKVVILRNSWRRISTGRKQADVKEALGPPTRETLMNGKVVWYYYYAGLGAGSVFFNGDGRISSSQSPNLGWGF
jgi:outer membrane lipoprotein-sorting protein